MDFIGFVTNNILTFIVIMTLLVFVHEWGHYWIGVRNGVKAEVFSVGFGRELFGWTSPKTGTRWKISILPLGGYVKFLGDSNPTGAGAVDDRLSEEERKRAFHTQPLVVRAAVVAAGPVANLLLAVVLMFVLLMTFGRPFTPPQIVVPAGASPAAMAGLRSGDVVTEIAGRSVDSFEDIVGTAHLYPGVPISIVFTRDGKTYYRSITPAPRLLVDRFKNEHRMGDLGIDSVQALPIVGRVFPGSAAEQAGLHGGDRIVDIEGTRIDYFMDIPGIIRQRPGQPTKIRIERKGETIEITAMPVAEQVRQPDGTTRIEGRLGFSSPLAAQVKRFGPLEAASQSVVEVWHMSGTIYTVLKQIVLGLRPANEIGGPIRIAKTAGEVSQIGWGAILYFVIGLSVTLGVFNLLPVPMLDGGHLLFYAIEWIRGRPLSERSQEIGFRIGLATMGGLMIFATYNDIVMIITRLLTL
jgi:regulator of sigma E protease